MVVKRNSEPKSFLEVIQDGRDVYQQEYDVVITEIEDAVERTAKKGPNSGKKFSTQKLKVSDGTDAIYMEITPDQYNAEWKVGDFLHLTGAYLKRLSVYWTVKTAQHPKGSCKRIADAGVVAVENDYEYETLKKIYDEDDSKPAAGKVNLSKHLVDVDLVFNALWDSLVNMSNEKKAIEWFSADEQEGVRDAIQRIKEAGLMTPDEE